MEITRFNNRFLPTFFRGFNGESFLDNSTEKKIDAAVNIMDRENNFLIELAVPGMRKENIEIELNENKLTIKGKTTTDKEIKEENYTHKEFSFGSFSRTFTLPEYSKSEAIEATYNNGILSISIAKPEAKKKIIKTIKIK